MNKKRIIILLIVILVILCIMLIYIKNFSDVDNQKNNTINSMQNNNGEQKVKQEEYVIVDSKDTYYSVINCVELYFQSLDLEDYITAYDMLDKDYIKDKEINKENISDKILYDRSLIYKIKRVEELKQDNNYYTYKVYGIKYNENIVNNYNEFMIIVNVDTNNKTFSIIPKQMD